MARTVTVTFGVFVATAWLSACGSDAPVSPSIAQNNSQFSLAAEAGAIGSVPAAYRSALPKVAYGRLQAIFADAATYWYDRDTMIPSYQDSVGDGSYTPIGLRKNSAGKGVIIPGAKNLFSADGSEWAFPFSRTAGLDGVSGVKILNFMSLPKNGTTLWPVAYWTVRDPNGAQGLGLDQWNWIYPKGTVFGEILLITDSDGALYPIEVRTRERFAQDWSANAFRPFPRAADLSAAIKQLRPQWSSTPALAAFIAHLDGDGDLRPMTLNSSDFPGTFSQSGYIDHLPTLGDPALVRQLLTTTLFKTAYGEAWKRAGDQVAYAPAATESFGLVPKDYHAGLIEVRDASCQRCHKDAGRAIKDFNAEAILYGDIWGKDRIFSFHPFDQTRYAIFNTDNRRVRPELSSAGLVAPYDAKTFPAAIYSNIRGGGSN